MRVPTLVGMHSTYSECCHVCMCVVRVLMSWMEPHMLPQHTHTHTHTQRCFIGSCCYTALKATILLFHVLFTRTRIHHTHVQPTNTFISLAHTFMHLRNNLHVRWINIPTFHHFLLLFRGDDRWISWMDGGTCAGANFLLFLVRLSFFWQWRPSRDELAERKPATRSAVCCVAHTRCQILPFLRQMNQHTCVDHL